MPLVGSYQGCSSWANKQNWSDKNTKWSEARTQMLKPAVNLDYDLFGFGDLNDEII